MSGRNSGEELELEEFLGKSSGRSSISSNNSMINRVKLGNASGTKSTNASLFLSPASEAHDEILPKRKKKKKRLSDTSSESFEVEYSRPSLPGTTDTIDTQPLINRRLSANATGDDSVSTEPGYVTENERNLENQNESLFGNFLHLLGIKSKISATKPRKFWVPNLPSALESTSYDKKSTIYPLNIVKNQKYSIITFLPITLYEQFKFFINLYFLLVALSQLIPALRIGYLFTYFAPLTFVLLVTLLKEAHDDYKRYKRDQEANSQIYTRLTPSSSFSFQSNSAVTPKTEYIPSSAIKVGDVIEIQKDQRVPADMILLRTSEKNGASFIRTDQLDGETDWKLRLAVPCYQRLSSDLELFSVQTQIYCDPPSRDIHNFFGTIKCSKEDGKIISDPEPLSVENTMWMNTVVASGVVLGLVVYTGKDTRAVMNTSHPGTKTGLLDLEVNKMTKILCVVTLGLAFLLIALNQFRGLWYIYVMRFLIIFSSIIPISLRVNLDLAKTFYSFLIMSDKKIPGTLVRTSNIPEELGRINYLLTDKTGTLTKNDMELKKLHMGTISYSNESHAEIRKLLTNGVENLQANFSKGGTISSPPGSLHGERKQSLKFGAESPSTIVTSNFQGRTVRHRDTSSKLTEMVLALALCHNVTPVTSKNSGKNEIHEISGSGDACFDNLKLGSVQYQASSPDEVAIVKWTESVGMMLVYRDMSSLVLKFFPEINTNSGSSVFETFQHGENSSKNFIGGNEGHSDYDGFVPTYLSFEILDVFPFSSDRKRMGIIIKDKTTEDITFYLKGADTVMSNIVQYNDWLDEECGNMAREGLRTLVVGRKKLTQQYYDEFLHHYSQAKVSVANRQHMTQSVISKYLEQDLDLLGLTGVEDKLQDDVKSSLEILRNAGLKIWMLTGDKIETATNIAISSKLVSRNQSIYHIQSLNDLRKAVDELDKLFPQHQDTCLVIDGQSIHFYLTHMKKAFIDLAVRMPAIVCCRCSPTQKASIVKLIKEHTKLRVCAIGDGGNDVSMIQAADVGVGIVGKEGKQASLASDFSVSQFNYLTRLLLWHGRNSYQRSAKLSQFIIHRGLIISIIQAVFSSLFYFAPIALYQGMLLVGYSTIYTMAPVFSLVLDIDVKDQMALTYPELYKELTKGRSLSFRTFFTWLLISIYQGGVIMLLAIWLFEDEFLHIISISFTALIFNELLMVAFEIKNWHKYMIYSELATLSIYLLSMVVLPTEFDLNFILSWSFIWKTVIITLISCFPLYVIRLLRNYYSPAVYQKLM